MTDKVAFTLLHEVHFTPQKIVPPGSVVLLDPVKEAKTIADLIAAEAIRESNEEEKAKVGLTRSAKPVVLSGKVDPKDEV